MKAVVFSDIHFGLKNNSDEFNKNCLDFIDFMIENSKGIEFCETTVTVNSALNEANKEQIKSLAKELV